MKTKQELQKEYKRTTDELIAIGEEIDLLERRQKDTSNLECLRQTVLERFDVIDKELGYRGNQ